MSDPIPALEDKRFDSHECARQMIQLADFLLAKPVFKMPQYETQLRNSFHYFSDKDNFLAAVRALKPGKKEFESGDNGDIMFIPDGIEHIKLSVKANRSAVCVLVKHAQPAVYDSLLEGDTDAERNSQAG